MRVILSSAVAAIVLASTGRAQSPEFDVASVKVNRTESGGSSFSSRNGEVAATDVSLLWLLRYAYDLGTPRILGPGWLDSDRYDVLAKSPAGTLESELRSMMQNLLKDRFRISAHWDKKEMPVYEMVVAKGGLKMTPFDPAQPQVSEMKPTPGATMSSMGLATMASLAKTISGFAGRPVINKTGLPGQYNYRLSFTSLATQSENASDPAPDFFAAIEQQLGLKLEPKRAPVAVLVIDRAERVPTEN